jgi:hypothetical protein
MLIVTGQATEAIEQSYRFADRFGFEALVAIVLLLGVGYLAKAFLEHWKTTTTDLANAQKDYMKMQADNGRELTTATRAIEQHMVTQNTEGVHRNAELDRMGRKVNSLHRGVESIIAACADELECEKPNVARRLRVIGDELGAEK